MSLLEVDGVVVQFGGVTAVDDASFAAEAGRVTGLIGPNGAGKTTCFNVISGLQKPNRGQVRFDGRSITRLSGAPALAPGDGPHLPAARGLRLADRARQRPGRPATSTAGSSACSDRPPPTSTGCSRRVGIRRTPTSAPTRSRTGAARLLELARCLAGDPKLLLLDEPSSGLDESETDAFGELLTRLATEGRGVLMVEHDMDLVMSVCDEIHVLDFGSVIASGTPAAIRTNRDVQRAYLGYAEDTRDDDTRDDIPAVELTQEIRLTEGSLR